MQIETMIHLFRRGTLVFAVLAILFVVATIAVAFFNDPKELNGYIKAEDAAIQKAKAEKEALKKKKRVVVSYVTESVQQRLNELFEMPPEPSGWTEGRCKN